MIAAGMVPPPALSPLRGFVPWGPPDLVTGRDLAETRGCRGLLTDVSCVLLSSSPRITCSLWPHCGQSHFRKKLVACTCASSCSSSFLKWDGQGKVRGWGGHRKLVKVAERQVGVLTAPPRCGDTALPFWISSLCGAQSRAGAAALMGRVGRVLLSGWQVALAAGVRPWGCFRNGLKITTPEEQFTLVSSTPQEKVSSAWRFLSAWPFMLVNKRHMLLLLLC